jgi:hypothetical protein
MQGLIKTKIGNPRALRKGGTGSAWLVPLGANSGTLAGAFAPSLCRMNDYHHVLSKHQDHNTQALRPDKDSRQHLNGDNGDDVIHFGTFSSTQEGASVSASTGDVKLPGYPTSARLRTSIW